MVGNISRGKNSRSAVVSTRTIIIIDVFGQYPTCNNTLCALPLKCTFDRARDRHKLIPQNPSHYSTRNARIQIPTTSRTTYDVHTHTRVRARNLPGAAALATYSARGQPAGRQHRFIYSPEPLLFHRSYICSLIYIHTCNRH